VLDGSCGPGGETEPVGVDEFDVAVETSGGSHLVDGEAHHRLDVARILLGRRHHVVEHSDSIRHWHVILPP
jgi:hypothetical protein